MFSSQPALAMLWLVLFGLWLPPTRAVFGGRLGRPFGGGTGGRSSRSLFSGGATVVPSAAEEPPAPAGNETMSSGSVLLSSATDNSTFTQSLDNDNHKETIYVTKRNGRREKLDRDKIYQRLFALVNNNNNNNNNSLNCQYLNLTALTDSIVRGMYPDVPSAEIDVLAAESAASLSTQHPDYARLAARILITQNHKNTPGTFTDAMAALYHPDSDDDNNSKSNNSSSFIDPQLYETIQKYGSLINAQIRHERDWHLLTYFGFKTLERAYLLRSDAGTVVERPQYLLMRVALGIHCCQANTKNQTRTDETTEPQDDDAKEEWKNLQAAFETYDYMSRGLFTHASPTLFHAGTTHPQLSSCFLVQMSDDSIAGIYDTLKQCACISKAAGGIGLSVHNIRARGTPIRGTRGVSNGLVPMLRVYDVTSRYVDQGGGKRPGAFAVYLEPWHADIFDVLNLKKNHGKEEQRARDLFYGLWIPDLFMQRVQANGVWSLMCPHQSTGLQTCHGAAFEELYQHYERTGHYVRQVRARDLWAAILESQMETGTPYMLYKDACNTKSNQQNLGTIQCSNLCTEIVQYTSSQEVAVCNLASLCLPQFVVSGRGPFGSVDHNNNNNNNNSRENSSDDNAPAATDVYYDHAALHRAAKIVTRNLNKIIDINSYPVAGSALSNLRHRPIGIGVSGLADTFLRLGLPFCSAQAKQLNQAIFETIYHAALEASVELAMSQGSYETFAGSPASRGQLQFNLWGMNDEETPSQVYSFQRQQEPQQETPSGTTTTTTETLTPVRQEYDKDVQKAGYDWAGLRERIMRHGLRNSLLLAPMPTASTSQILGVNECFEPFSSNLYLRRVKAGEFIMANPHLLQDLTDRGLWTPSVRNQLMRDGGSVQNIAEIPERLKELYKTVWEIKMKDIIDMAADRGKFVDQSQSLNLFIADPTVDKLTAMHFYAWKKGLKTGMYYLRTKPAVNAIQYTVDNSNRAGGSATSAQTTTTAAGADIPVMAAEGDVCISCSA